MIDVGAFVRGDNVVEKAIFERPCFPTITRGNEIVKASVDEVKYVPKLRSICSAAPRKCYDQ